MGHVQYDYLDGRFVSLLLQKRSHSKKIEYLEIMSAL